MLEVEGADHGMCVSGPLTDSIAAPLAATDFTTLLARADAALYEAKRAGRNHVATA